MVPRLSGQWFQSPRVAISEYPFSGIYFRGLPSLFEKRGDSFVSGNDVEVRIPQ